MQITERDIAVLELTAVGASIREISEDLNLSEYAVRKTLGALAVHFHIETASRPEIVAHAYHEGVLATPAMARLRRTTAELIADLDELLEAARHATVANHRGAALAHLDQAHTLLAKYRKKTS